MNEALLKLVHVAAKLPMSDVEREEQRVRFSYGSAKIENDDVTEEMVRSAADQLRLEMSEPNG